MHKLGFTIIELLVVIGVIILVTGISLFSVQNARESAADDKRLADLRSIQSALARFNSDCFGFPLESEMPSVGDPFDGIPSYAPSCLDTNIYMKAFPTDPDPTRSYYYRVTDIVGGKGVSYILCAALTVDDEPASDVTGCGANCGSMACNVKVTN